MEIVDKGSDPFMEEDCVVEDIRLRSAAVGSRGKKFELSPGSSLFAKPTPVVVVVAVVSIDVNEADTAGEVGVVSESLTTRLSFWSFPRFENKCLGTFTTVVHVK